MSYRVVHKQFWTDADMRSLPRDARNIAQFLLTGPHSNMIGCMFVPTLQMVDYVFPFEQENNTLSDTVPDTVSDTVLPTLIDMLERGLEHLVRIGLIRRCPKTKWIWIVNYMRYNPIPNPSAGISAMKLIKEIPKDVRFYRDIILNFLDFSQQESDPKKQRLDVSELQKLLDLGDPHSEISHSVGHGVPHGDSRANQDQDQDHITTGSANADSSSASDDAGVAGPVIDNSPLNQKTGTGPGAVDKPPGADPPADFPDKAFQIWLGVVGDALPVPKNLHRDRRKKLKLRLADSFENDLGRWKDYCARIRGSPHLIGDGPRGWRADFDWCLKPENLRKIIEGNYDGPRLGAATSIGREGRPERGVAASHAATVAELRRRKASAG